MPRSERLARTGWIKWCASQRTIFLFNHDNINGPAQGGWIDRIPGLGDGATDTAHVLHPATFDGEDPSIISTIREEKANDRIKRGNEKECKGSGGGGSRRNRVVAGIAAYIRPM